MLNFVTADLMRLSEDEPYGVKGANVIVKFAKHQSKQDIFHCKGIYLQIMRISCIRATNLYLDKAIEENPMCPAALCTKDILQFCPIQQLRFTSNEFLNFDFCTFESSSSQTAMCGSRPSFRRLRAING